MSEYTDPLKGVVHFQNPVDGHHWFPLNWYIQHVCVFWMTMYIWVVSNWTDSSCKDACFFVVVGFFSVQPYTYIYSVLYTQVKIYMLCPHIYYLVSSWSLLQNKPLSGWYKTPTLSQGHFLFTVISEACTDIYLPCLFTARFIIL